MDVSTLFSVEPAKCVSTIKYSFDFLPWNHAFMYKAMEWDENGLFKFYAEKTRDQFVRDSDYKITVNPKTQRGDDLPISKEITLIVQSWYDRPRIPVENNLLMDVVTVSAAAAAVKVAVASGFRHKSARPVSVKR